MSIGGYNAAVTVTAASLTLTDLSRDMIVYDASVGGVASVPLSGSAPSGQVVQARAVSLDDGGFSTTAWADIATASGGVWAGSLPAPRNTSWYRPEVRLRDTPAVTATTARKFAAGTTVLVFGQSEDQNMTADFYDSSATVDVVPRMRNQIAALKTNTRLRGRQSTAALKIPGVDALPSGCTYSAGGAYPVVTVNSGTHVFTDWDFSNTLVDVQSGASVGLTNCVLNQSGAAGLTAQFACVYWRAGSTCSGVSWCTLIGPEDRSSVNPCLRMQDGVALTGNIERNCIYGWVSDAMAISGCPTGTEVRIRWNYIRYTRSMPASTTTWSAGTAYVTGDPCLYNGFAYFAARASTGAAPTGALSSNADWTVYDPHLDPFYFTGGGAANLGLVRICDNFVECDDTVLLRGVNNFVRISVGETPSAHGPITIERNRFIRGATVVSWPIQVYTNNPASLGTVTVRHNEVTSQSGPTSQNVLYPTTGGATLIWGENTRASDGTVYTTPAGATGTDSTVDTTGQDDVQVIWHNRLPLNTGAAGVQHQFVSNAAWLRMQFTALARAWLLTRPGEKLAVGMVTQNGTGWPETLSDSPDTTRYWADDLAVADRVKAGGTIGCALMSWYASTSQYANDFAGLLHQLISGKTTAGATVTVPGTISHGATSFAADHLFSDLASPGTIWMIHGPHRSEPTYDQTDYRTYVTPQAGQATDVTKTNRELCRMALRTVFPSVHAPNVRVAGVEPLNCIFGRDNAGTWTDWTHPGTGDDGSKRYFALKALAAAHALGMVGWDVPVLDQSYWAPGGTYAEFWSSAGPVTTTRLARGLAALPATHPHWTDVFAFEIDGTPAQHVSIVAGRIRVSPNSGTFNASTAITFGKGGATGNLLPLIDMPAETWMNFPIVDVGQAYVEGLALRPMPDPAVLASTL